MAADGHLFSCDSASCDMFFPQWEQIGLKGNIAFAIPIADSPQCGHRAIL
jgi:hypothetical protein